MLLLMWIMEEKTTKNHNTKPLQKASHLPWSLRQWTSTLSCDPALAWMISSDATIFKLCTILPKDKLRILSAWFLFYKLEVYFKYGEFFCKSFLQKILIVHWNEGENNASVMLVYWTSGMSNFILKKTWSNDFIAWKVF